MPHYLIATDADWVLDEVRAALEAPGTTLTVCRRGQEVAPAVAANPPDLAVLDLQIGTMGAIAVTMELRLEESGGRLDHVPVLLLLDRRADTFLASRAGAEGWLVKPLDSLRLRRAAATILDGGTVYEGIEEVEAPAPAGEAEPEEPDDVAIADGDEVHTG